jgi:Zn-finger nucleic acid-binding protein
MNCPRCHTAELVEKDRTGILIDICKGCRGVWLDRGELDKLIAHAVQAAHDGEEEDRGELADRQRARRVDGDDDDGRPGRRRWWDIFD